MVVDNDTDKGIAGARVTVRRMISSSQRREILEESQHVTDKSGKYTIVIPPEQLAKPALYIELDVHHEDYASKAGFGYAMGMIRKNERLGERPFFETVKLKPADQITGRLVTKDGQPAAGVKMIAYSKGGCRRLS